ncbi:mitochondrial 39-S ribosomal protein L47 (MRP-L47)-domain-containing protein [Syncephalastrum racemosum]|uniref:Large ribosomal subunit protein uL29m n=1 Tax=Syncephalastrum racemosum TaxID=13706 RepID=A0A1X2HJ31_SYNRA|nr:mitochondrial 39-S ribosomal protein L47 (MRP-L47)-domain-containing protein [Syncephalastrum racemosum]
MGRLMGSHKFRPARNVRQCKAVAYPFPLSLSTMSLSILQHIAASAAKRQFSTAAPALSSKGLYQFFENGEALPKSVETGRSWSAQELRNKSFDDLHKLWYVLLKERNVLATQRDEARRLGLHKQVWDNGARYKKVRQSMARIKFVLTERQLAYESSLAQKEQPVQKEEQQQQQ